jgi:hypothetical protein
MSTEPSALVIAARRQEAAGVARWEKLRKWSRTDSARWVNDRSAAALAWLRRRPGQWPAHSNQLGYWLRDHAPEVFDRIHNKLAGMSPEAREQTLPGSLL